MIGLGLVIKLEVAVYFRSLSNVIPLLPKFKCFFSPEFSTIIIIIAVEAMKP